ncbi:hypothetical protein AKJ36_00330 [candidate division MSBL1 archaeon SCGC-AAA259I07]|uniref:Transcription regulator PadR N-terminal domain-containing protein n=2 Tax=candidate division MSBL1 TaxID=215777 RepID=A0A133U913_9EURY|nr:hypothetical protein AKJ61_00115 [candidate division MSBL1 archaeon SCGC-AAA259B11]KXA95526.1 hypothetical protein AKJ36_00330 [candidate division MSBL1 archaeon SCGC-AAA259I07]
MKIDPSSKSSRTIILEDLLRDDLTAIELAEGMDLGTSTVRDHLRTLQEKGYVEHYFERASKGRPKKKYAITLEGRKLFPRGYERLISKLLLNIESEYGEEKLRELLVGVAGDMAGVGRDLLKKDMETRLDEMVSFFEDMNLYPSLSREDGSYLIEYGNCGNLEIIEEFHRYLCYTHRRIVTNFLPECEVEQVKSYGRGDDICIHRIFLE